MEPHGTYRIQLLDRVIYVSAKGPFNDDAVKAYSRDLTSSIQTLAPDPWSLCAVFKNESLFTPEAETELTAVTRWRKDKGMHCVAVVLQDIREKVIFQAQMEKIYSTVGVTHAFFDDTASAFSWLAEHGFPCTTIHSGETD